MSETIIRNGILFIKHNIREFEIGVGFNSYDWNDGRTYCIEINIVNFTVKIGRIVVDKNAKFISYEDWSC